MDRLKRNIGCCLLIGGKSSRMGTAKHLLKTKDGKTWFERTIAVVSPFFERLVVAGKGTIPEAHVGIERVADIYGLKGPMAGILGAMRQYPNSSWVVVACDMPLLSRDAVQWLLIQTEVFADSIAVVPQNLEYKEPLFAFYRCDARELFEKSASDGVLSVSSICKNSAISSPAIPEHLSGCWLNVNDQTQLEKLRLI